MDHGQRAAETIVRGTPHIARDSNAMEEAAETRAPTPSAATTSRTEGGTKGVKDGGDEGVKDDEGGCDASALELAASALELDASDSAASSARRRAPGRASRVASPSRRRAARRPRR